MGLVPHVDQNVNGCVSVRTRMVPGRNRHESSRVREVVFGATKARFADAEPKESPGNPGWDTNKLSSRTE